MRIAVRCYICMFGCYQLICSRRKRDRNDFISTCDGMKVSGLVLEVVLVKEEHYLKAVTLFTVCVNFSLLCNKLYIYIIVYAVLAVANVGHGSYGKKDRYLDHGFRYVWFIIIQQWPTNI